VTPQLTKEDEEGMTYLKFTKLVRHSIAKANPGAEHTKINALLGAMWQDYKISKDPGGDANGKKSRANKGKRASGKRVKHSRKHVSTIM
jgi:hypothetical protein